MPFISYSYGPTIGHPINSSLFDSYLFLRVHSVHLHVSGLVPIDSHYPSVGSSDLLADPYPRTDENSFNFVLP